MQLDVEEGTEETLGRLILKVHYLFLERLIQGQPPQGILE
jgi:hypothetical protein